MELTVNDGDILAINEAGGAKELMPLVSSSASTAKSIFEVIGPCNDFMSSCKPSSRILSLL